MLKIGVGTNKRTSLRHQVYLGPQAFALRGLHTNSENRSRAKAFVHSREDWPKETAETEKEQGSVICLSLWVYREMKCALGSKWNAF